MYYKRFDKDIKLSNRNIQRIINFYLFNCPTPGKSVRANTFAQLGWEGSPQFSQLKKRLLAASCGNLRENYFPCIKNELPQKFRNVANVKPPNEYCVFLKQDEKTVMQSLFSAIRNAFAHGSFNVKTYNGVKIYYFENFNGYLKAEIVLHEETLLAWIPILEAGYNPIQ